MSGFQLSEQDSNYPILQYTDNTLFMFDGPLKEAKVARNILMWFEACSGVSVNTKKNQFCVKLIMWMLGVPFWRFGIVNLVPSLILIRGFLLGAKYRSILIWDPLLDKVGRRLALWKSCYLSKGGRLVLIKSTLQNLPVYILYCRLMPVTVVYEVERIIRRFLWGTMEGRDTFHLVAFYGVC